MPLDPGLPPSAPARDAVAPSRLKGTLGPVAIVFMVVAAASPLTVIGGAAPLGILLGNGPGYPALFLPVTLALLVFAVGLNAMARRIAKPGAFYTYIGHGLGAHAGTAAAWTALLCYTTVQLAVHAYLGHLIGRGVAGLGGPDLPWWLYTLAMIGCVGILGYRHIDLSSRVLGLLLVCEILVVALVAAGVVITGGADGLSAEPFAPSTAMTGAPGVGLVFAIGAYIGFEATAVYRDEARTPERTIPRATYGALIGIGVFYALGTWAMVAAWGVGSISEKAAEDPGALLQATAGLYLGAAGPLIVDVLIITSMFACVLSFHNVLARYALSMSASGLMPRGLGRVHGSHASPHRGSLLQTVVAVLLTVVMALCGLDPVLQVFTWLSGIAVVAALLLMLATSVAVVVYLRADRRAGHSAGLWRSVIAPVLGGASLAGFLGLVIVNFPVLVEDLDAAGEPAFGIVSRILLGACLLAVLIGIVQAEVLRRRSPLTYSHIIDTMGEHRD